jgi:hypothetical protein
MTVDLKALDRKIWSEELDEFLPERIFDTHMHLFDSSCIIPGTAFAPKTFFHKFGGTFSQQQFLNWAEEWLPGRILSACHFGFPSFDFDLDASAIYSGSISDNRQFFGLALVAPRDSGETVRERTIGNGLLGYKPYLDFVEDKPKDEVTIHDMLPAAQMKVANELGLVIMLHIPRPGRLADPVNQKQMVELCRSYPNAKIIFAHIGRAYWMKNVIGFLKGIASCSNAYIDTAMVNHEGVLAYAFENFPRERILFGSDAPIACLRGRSIETNDNYAYLMGEDYEIGSSIYDADHAAEFTSFYYEQLCGIRLAASRAGLTPEEIENILFGNANRLFSGVAKRQGYPTDPKRL